MAEITKPNYQEIWASSGSVVAPDDSKIRQGWVEEQPASQHENYLQRRQDEAIKYLFQRGVAEWDAGEEYFRNKSVVLLNGKLYLALSNNTNKNPTTSTADWKDLISLSVTDISGLQTQLDSKASKTELTSGLTLKADKTVTVSAGNGLTGGGNLSGNISMSLGTPSNITANSTNFVTNESHGHSIDKASLTTAGVVKLNNTLTSTSTSEALTAAQGKVLYDLASQGGVGALQKANNLSDVASAVASRSNLGLGSASILNSQTGVTDTTAGRLMLMGAFGTGYHISLGETNLNTLVNYGSTYIQGASINATVERGYPTGAEAGVLEVFRISTLGSGAGGVCQRYTNYRTGVSWWRQTSDGNTWTTWHNYWSSSNFDPNTKANTSSLGTAAFKNVGTNAGDVVMDGGYGIGRGSNHLNDFNDVTIPNGFYNWGMSSSNKPSGIPNYGIAIVSGGVGGITSNHRARWLIDLNSDRFWFQRSVNMAAWTAPQEIYHTGNLPTTATRWPTWNEVTSKPTTFAPSSHTHAWGEISGKPATFPPVIGTAANQAKAGNWIPSYNDVSKNYTAGTAIRVGRAKAVNLITFGRDNWGTVAVMRAGSSGTIRNQLNFIWKNGGSNAARILKNGSQVWIIGPADKPAAASTVDLAVALGDTLTLQIRLGSPATDGSPITTTWEVFSGSSAPLMSTEYVKGNSSHTDFPNGQW